MEILCKWKYLLLNKVAEIQWKKEKKFSMHEHFLLLLQCFQVSASDACDFMWGKDFGTCYEVNCCMKRLRNMLWSKLLYPLCFDCPFPINPFSHTYTFCDFAADSHYKWAFEQFLLMPHYFQLYIICYPFPT